MAEDDDASPADAATLLSEYVQRSLDSDRAAYDRLEVRAGAIVTTTGGLVTAIGAVAAFVPEGQRSHAFSTPSLVLVVLALVLFLVSVTLAQGSNVWSGPRIAVSDTAFERLAAGEVGTTAGSEDLLAAFTSTDVAILRSFRASARKKGLFLNWATLSQMAGVIALTAAVITVIVKLT